MRVGKIMVTKPITVSPEASVHQALRLMQHHGIRHLPVMTGDKFAGWVTARDLYQVLLAAMIEKITVQDVMITDPITVSPMTPIDEAAHLMHDYKIGGVPVLEGERLVGVLTVADLLSTFLYLLDVLRSSARFDLVLDERPEAFEEVSRLIREGGGRIINVALRPEGPGKRIYSFRVEKCDLTPIIRNLNAQGYKVIDIS